MRLPSLCVYKLDQMCNATVIDAVFLVLVKPCRSEQESHEASEELVSLKFSSARRHPWRSVTV